MGTVDAGPIVRAVMTVTVAEATELLAVESELLDERQFAEWNDMFDTDGIYWVTLQPRAGGEYDPLRTPSLIYDDATRRRERVIRLLQTRPHSQNPPSETIHHIGNVRVKGDVVTCTLFLAELRNGDQGQFFLGEQRVYAASCRYLLVERDGRMKFKEKRVNLLNRSAPLHNLSFIL